MSTSEPLSMVSASGVTPEQDGQRVLRLAELLLERRQGGALVGDDGALLRQVQRRGGAVVHARLDDRQHAFRVGKVLVGDRKAVAEFQDHEICRRDIGEDSDRYSLAVVAGRQRQRLRRVQRRAVLPQKSTS